MGTNAVGDSILETDIEGWLRFKIVNAEMVAIPGEENKVVCFILQDSNFHFQFSNYLFNFFENIVLKIKPCDHYRNYRKNKYSSSK